MQYSDKDLEALISEVETEFEAYLGKSEDQTAEEVVTEAKEALAKGEEEAEEETQEETQLAKSEEDSDEENLSYDDEDIKEMNELYSSMTKSEKEAHYKALKSVIFEKEEETEEPAKMAKSEDSEESDEASSDLLAKHEELVKQNEELKKSVGKLVGLLSQNVKTNSAPKQKAITTIEYMKKSEDEVPVSEEDKDFSKLSKKEINSRLNEKIRNGELKKSDHERVNAFVMNEISIDKIKDLL